MDSVNPILHGEVGYYNSPNSPERKHAINLTCPNPNILGTPRPARKMSKREGDTQFLIFTFSFSVKGSHEGNGQR
jgi:hypothetical protein